MVYKHSRAISLLATSAIIASTLSVTAVHADNNTATTSTSQSSTTSSSSSGSSVQASSSSSVTTQSVAPATRSLKIPSSKFTLNGRTEIKSGTYLNVNRQNIAKYVGMGGTVTKVTQQKYSISNYVYQIRLDDGTILDGVLEQDLTNYVAQNKYQSGNAVQINDNVWADVSGNRATKYAGLSGKITKIVSHKVSNSKYTYDLTLDDGQVVTGILEQDLSPYVAQNKYQLTNRVRINDNIWATIDGARATKYAGLGGKITGVTHRKASKSKYVYNITLDDGRTIAGVLEQDLSTYTDAKYPTNSSVQISSGARFNLNRHNITKYANQVGTVSSSRHFNYSLSHFVYTVKLSDGTVLTDVLEQDVRSFNHTNKYKSGQNVNLAGNAWRNSDGKRIDSYRGYVGAITGVKYKKASNSNYVYDIKLDNGAVLTNVLEQDVNAYSAGNNAYANDALVQISSGAWATASGDKSLNQKHGWYGKISKITRFSGSNSRYMYSVTFTNGSRVDNVLEQDIKPFNYTSDQAVNKDMVIDSSKRSDGMYSNYPAPVPTSQWAGNTKSYNNTRVHVSRLVKTNSGTSWYLVTLNGKNYYIDAQGLKDYVAPKAKYAVNDQLAIAGNAWANKDGQRITQYQNQNVTVTSVTAGQYSNSNYTYNVKLTNGTVVTGVLEQDLVNVNQSAFNVGGSAYITKGAWATANGTKINMKAGKHVTITAKYARSASKSKWQYDIKLDNGRVYKNVLEQDLQANKVVFTVDSNKVVAWFENHKGKLTYSMYGSRNGTDGTADCSGSITQALYEAGASPYDYLYSTETIHDYLKANGYKLIVENDYNGWNAEKGDIVIWGKQGQSGGAGGHIGVMSNNDDNPLFISTCYITRGQTNTAVQEVRYNQYVAQDNYPYYYVYRLAK